MLARIARFSFHRKWIMILAVWLPLLVVLNGLAGAVGSDYHTEFNQPDSESKQVQDALKDADREADAGFPAQIVFSAKQGNEDPAVKAAITELLGKVAQEEGVTVVSPYSPEGAQQNSPAGSPTNKLGADVSFAQLSITEREQSEVIDLANRIQDDGKSINVPGLEIEYGGQVFQKQDLPSSALLGIIAAIVILFIAFGSAIAMGLPVGTAMLGIGGLSLPLVKLLSRGMSMPDFAESMTEMIGLGVGIDYVLFIVSRYREHLHLGEDPETAAVAAINSSGRAVLFAGTTVIISLLGLFIIGLSFVKGMAVAGAVGVLVMMFASITLLPALLGLVGRRIETTSRAAALGVALIVVLGLVGVVVDVPFLFLVGVVLFAVLVAISFIPPLRGPLHTPIPARAAKPRDQRFWYKWSRAVQHRPTPFLIGAAAALVVLALPLFSIRLGFGDEGNAAKDTTIRKAYDLISDGFGPGINGPLYMASTDPKATAATVQAVTDAIKADPGIAFITPAIDVGNGTWFWRAYPTTASQDEVTTRLVERLRDTVIPGTGIDVNVGGITAGGIDFADYLAGRLPLLIGAVLILSFLLLMAVFRSLLVPLKAVVMNLLSVGAAYGVLVAIFQWGWGLGIIGVDKAGPIEAWVPMMLFAIVFGLSMDYEVFLLSRIKEEYDRTHDNATAVADGLAATARVITAAALIMVCVFLAFALGDDRSLKLFGLGMAIAVFLDATVVRMVLVPATMELLGDRNWWIPKWMDKILPRIDVEGVDSPTPLEPDRDHKVPEPV